MLIEEVLVANMVSGRTSAASDANKDVFNWTFSAAAWLVILLFTLPDLVY